MTEADLGFVHRLVPATEPGRPPLLLLHGTGGGEHDLIPIGQAVSPGSALLSPRGRVTEGNMLRFFRRTAEGLFDPAEVRQRADELADFVGAARAHYGLEAPMALGFSNGANVASVAMLRRPGLLAGAVLLRPAQVLDDEASAPAAGPVLILSGADDPIIPAPRARALAEQLQRAGARVEHRFLPAAHALTRRDAVETKRWLEALGTSSAA